MNDTVLDIPVRTVRLQACRAGRQRAPAGPGRMTDAPDAAALIAAIAREADCAAFGTLFGWYAPRVKSYLQRQGASAAAAEELAQETMLNVWRKAAYFDPTRAAASTWIFAIARNLRIDALRRERHPGELDIEDLPPPPETPNPDAALAAAELEQRIRTAIAALPKDQADVIRLSFYQDAPHSEIERRLGVPLGTVKSRMRLALTRLRNMLGDDA